MKFEWRYALDKLLIFLTSTKNIALATGALYAIFGFELPAEYTAPIVAGALFFMAVLKAWEDTSR